MHVSTSYVEEVDNNNYARFSPVKALVQNVSNT